MIAHCALVTGGQDASAPDQPPPAPKPAEETAASQNLKAARLSLESRADSKLQSRTKQSLGSTPRGSKANAGSNADAGHLPTFLASRAAQLQRERDGIVGPELPLNKLQGGSKRFFCNLSPQADSTQSQADHRNKRALESYEARRKIQRAEKDVRRTPPMDDWNTGYSLGYSEAAQQNMQGASRKRPLSIYLGDGKPPGNLDRDEHRLEEVSPLPPRLANTWP
jgi:hypothetical protein